MIVPDLSGEKLGKFWLVERLGAGGMGEVYVGEHETIGKRVAIKLLRPALAARPDQLKRFFNEARAAAHIEHPNIINIYDCDVDERLGACLVMELLDGEPLSRRMARVGQLPLDEVAYVLESVGGALQAAHERGIVHRDLKPDNIFLCGDAVAITSSRVVLLDFGIAKLAESLTSVTATAAGTVMGTPLYMSPEQCKNAADVDHRTDVYSLGVVAYEALCGRPPFVEADLAALLRAHLSQRPPAPRFLRFDLSVSVERVLLKALAKRPRDRFQSVSELVAALSCATAEALAPAWIDTRVLTDTVPAGALAVPATAPAVSTPVVPATEVVFPPTQVRKRAVAASGGPGAVGSPAGAGRAIRKRRHWLWLGCGAVPVMLAVVALAWSLQRGTPQEAAAASPAAAAAAEKARPTEAPAARAVRPGAVAQGPLVEIFAASLELDRSTLIHAGEIDFTGKGSIDKLKGRLLVRARETPDPKGRGLRAIRICASRLADMRYVSRAVQTARAAGFGQVYLGLPGRKGSFTDLSSTAFSIVDPDSGCTLARLTRPLKEEHLVVRLDGKGGGRYVIRLPEGSGMEVEARGRRFDHRGLLWALRRIRSEMPWVKGARVEAVDGVEWDDVILATETIAVLYQQLDLFTEPVPFVAAKRSAASRRRAPAARARRRARRSARSPAPAPEGILEKETIRRVILSSYGKVRACYERGLARNAQLRGRVDVEFTIARSGQVVASKVVGSTLRDRAVEACIARAARGFRFPARGVAGITMVTYPFVLRTR